MLRVYGLSSPTEQLDTDTHLHFYLADTPADLPLTGLEAGADVAFVISTDALHVAATGTTWGSALGSEVVGAPVTADYLVGTSQVGLSAEIVVGPTPGGELGGTWAAPTVDTTHAGSAHHTAFIQADHDALPNPHHSNATDHAQSHTHASHTGIGASDHHTAFVQADHDGLPNPHHSNANDHAQSHTLTSHSTRTHSELTSIGVDDHHTQSHTHASHTGIGANDHHNQAHSVIGADHTAFPGGTSTFLRADATFAAPTGAPPALTTVEKSLGASWRRSGNFQITGLSGLTAGKPVSIQQANGPYTGKGTREDEAEMDQLLLTGKVLNTTTIQCYWQSRFQVRGNFKVDYLVGA
jgi:hypothetical protein